MQTFDLGGHVALSIAEPEESELSFLASQMDPYRAGRRARATRPPSSSSASTGGPAPRSSTCTATPATAASPAPTASASTCSTSERALRDPAARRRPGAFRPPAGLPAVARLRLGDPPGAAAARCTQRGAVALHSASVVTERGGVVVAGWSESGKTETALAFAEDGRTLLLGQVDDPRRRRASGHLPDARGRPPLGPQRAPAAARLAARRGARPDGGGGRRQRRHAPAAAAWGRPAGQQPGGGRRREDGGPRRPRLP